MHFRAKEIVGMPIRSSDNAMQLARVVDLVVNPTNGEIVALFTDAKRQHILPTADIREIVDGSVWATHDEAICPVDDIVRIADVLAQRAPLLGAKVFTLGGRPLGTVHDCVFETTHCVVLQLDVAKSILGIPTEQKLIDTRQIVRIDRRGVVVNDTEMRDAERSAVLAEMQQVSNAATYQKS